MCENQDPDLPVVSSYYSMNRLNRSNENNTFFNILKSEKYHSTDIDSTNTLPLLSNLKTEAISLFECHQCHNTFKSRRELLFHQDFDHIDLVENSASEKDVVALASIYQTDSFKFKIKLLSTENSEITDKKPLVKLQKTVLADVTQNSKTNLQIDEPLICPLCNFKDLKQFKSKKTFKQHMTRSHRHNASLFKKSQKICKFCKSKFSSYDDLLCHYYYCIDLCYTKKVSTKKISGLNYVKPSVSPKIFRCCMCLKNEAFPEEPFKIHLMLEHNLYKTKIFPRDKRQCIDCGRFITSYKVLREHCKRCVENRFL